MENPKDNEIPSGAKTSFIDSIDTDPMSNTEPSKPKKKKLRKYIFWV